MNINYTLNGISFEWDREKAETNLLKHKISFEKACEIFFDPFILTLTNDYINGEERERIIGLTFDWRLLYVAYIWRNDTIRIISARTVTPLERKQYENQ
jgi:hypothetical protein